MGSSLRCKMSGHDLDPCGICRRCADSASASHSWKDAERERPCFRLRVCETCGSTEEKPEHKWEPAPRASGIEGPMGPDLKCSRCGLVI